MDLPLEDNRSQQAERPLTADDGPAQKRNSPDGVAQKRQESTGLGSGQS